MHLNQLEAQRLLVAMQWQPSRGVIVEQELDEGEVTRLLATTSTRIAVETCRASPDNLRVPGRVHRRRQPLRLLRPKAEIYRADDFSASDTDPSKPQHSVFDLKNAVDVFKVVDEVWALRATRTVKTVVQGDRTTYTIDMGRRIGTKPGQNYLRITVEFGNEVITAFPDVRPPNV
ncbi:hypothetical protein AB0368_07270 [Actinoplanes sp. NPDC051475]|uniref:hypothetical protein n=1 Tax=Actinoplanes sp. NPDC051475 TaxID=3157225 RepID=UPI00344F1748